MSVAHRFGVRSVLGRLVTLIRVQPDFWLWRVLEWGHKMREFNGQPPDPREEALRRKYRERVEAILGVRLGMTDHERTRPCAEANERSTTT